MGIGGQNPDSSGAVDFVQIPTILIIACIAVSIDAYSKTLLRRTVLKR